ncbi:MAG: hypothetical protein ACM33V_07620 [Chloroflexota bacterium]|nr:hypothetical protein [Anaerolineales bacterium]
MGKYSTYTRKQSKRPTGVHPVMRGIGCIMIVVVPILAYGVSMLVVNYGIARGWPIPKEWLGQPAIPQLLWGVQSLTSILYFLQGQNNLVANLAFSVAMIIIIGGIMAVIYGFLYSIFGPPQYGPQDAPPIKGRKIKAYKR